MGIAYDPTIPSTGGRPSAQYLDIRDNFASIQTLLDRNHVDFNDANYGFHTRLDFPAPVVPAASGGDASVAYPTTGVASTRPNFAFQNSNDSFILNLIKAYVVFDNAGLVLNNQKMNITSVSIVGQIATIVFDPTAIILQSFGVLVSTNSTAAHAYTITGNNTVTITTGFATNITVIALQI